MIYSCFILGYPFHYKNINWHETLNKLKNQSIYSFSNLEKVDKQLLEEIKEFILEKYNGDIDLVTTSGKKDPEIDELVYHLSIVLPENIELNDLHTEVNSIMKNKVKLYEDCLEFLELNKKPPKLYSVAYRL